MGGVFSRLRGDNSGDYEEILSAIDEKLRRAEISLSGIAVREKKVLAVWIIYSVFFYLVYVVAYVIYLRVHLTGRNFLVASAGLLLAPLGIYLVRNIICAYYARQRLNEEARLENLLALQRDKVEELKKKSAYYTTKSLLDRYETPQRGRPKVPTAMDAITPTRPPGARPPNSPASVPGKGLGSPTARPDVTPPDTRPALTAGTSSGAPGATGVSPGLTSAKLRAPSKAEGTDDDLLQTPPSSKQQRQSTPGMSMPTPYARQTPQPRAWYDKLVDVVIGDEGPETKYALICGKCFAHNGLVVAEEYDDIHYVCPHCGYFNPSRRKRRERASGKDQSDLDVSKTRRVNNVTAGDYTS